MNESQGSKGQRRREQIMQLLKRQGRLTIQEIVDQLGCSEATARRDLEALEKTEPLIRTIGGALYRGMHAPHDLAFAEKTEISYLEKERIAAKAASLIHEGDVIGLSGGTTNYLLAKMLKIRRGITVVTNAINIAMELAGSDIQVVVTGGIMRHNSFELCGPLGEGMVSHLNIGKMFIGATGLLPIAELRYTPSRRHRSPRRCCSGRAGRMRCLTIRKSGTHRCFLLHFPSSCMD